MLITDGSFAYDHRDIYIPGKGSALYIQRYYNSGDRIKGPFGYGWSFMPYAQVIETVKGTETYAIVRWGNGVRLDFLKDADGSYTTPAGFYFTLLRTASGFTLTSPENIVHIFDASGKLTAVASGAATLLSFSYDAAGRLSGIEDLNQRALTFVYEGGTFPVKEIRDHAGRTVQYAYDDGNNLRGVTDAAGGTISYGYDDAHNLKTMMDERGNTYVSQNFDATCDRVTNQISIDGTYNFYYYPSKERGGSFSTAYTDVRRNFSQRTLYYYNTSGKVTRIYDYLTGKNIYMAYDANLNMTEYTDPANKKTTYTYDANGNITSVKNFFNETTVIDYHPVFNTVSKITYPNGQEVVFEYTAGGALSKVTQPDGTEATYTYGTNTVALSEPDGTTTFTFDAFNYVTSITDKDGTTTSYTYDAVGNVRTLMDASGTSSYTYDGKDRLLTATDPANQTTTYGYDAHGNLTTVDYPDGTSHSFSYDGYNRLIDIEQHLGHLVPPTYNSTYRVRQKTGETLGKYAAYRYLAGLLP